MRYLKEVKKYKRIHKHVCNKKTIYAKTLFEDMRKCKASKKNLEKILSFHESAFHKVKIKNQIKILVETLNAFLSNIKSISGSAPKNYI